MARILLKRANRSTIEANKASLNSYEIVYAKDTNEIGVKNTNGTVSYFGGSSGITSGTVAVRFVDTIVGVSVPTDAKLLTVTVHSNGMNAKTIAVDFKLLIDEGLTMFNCEELVPGLYISYEGTSGSNYLLYFSDSMGYDRRLYVTWYK